MPKINTRESIQIDAAPAAVFPKVADFNHWAAWSPWLILEPGATVTVGENGKTYAWEGKRVGSGRMEVTAEEGNRSVDYSLTFLKPFKSNAAVRFQLEEVEGGTRVTWSMDSSLPFFLFFMAKPMRVMIAMDYRRGLTMLKDYVEKGGVPSKLEFVAREKFAGCTYVGVKMDYSASNISAEMEKAFDTLWKSLEEAGLQPAGPPFAIYHKFDPVKDIASSTCAVSVENSGDSLPAPLVSGSYPATDVYTLRHVGPYRHIGNAWATIQSLIRNKVFEPSKSLHPIELYVNDPRDTREEELITDIRFPLAKGA